MTLFPMSTSNATFSECERYRYSLRRHWDHDKPAVCFAMLNPSTADAFKDDPTIRRCIGFAKAWGAGGLVVVNLFALRATNPDELYSHASPVAAPSEEHPFYGDRNTAEIIMHSDGLRLVAAWGTHGNLRGRARQVMDALGAKRRVECLGVTKDGHPRHPLYVAAATVPVPFVIGGAP